MVVARDAGLLLPSSIVAGTALVILIDMWISKAWRRPSDEALSSVGQITFWSLVVYLAFRLGDMAIRDQLGGAFSGRLGLAFAVEILLGGVVPLVLSRKAFRDRPDVLSPRRCSRSSASSTTAATWFCSR